MAFRNRSYGMMRAVLGELDKIIEAQMFSDSNYYRSLVWFRKQIKRRLK